MSETSDTNSRNGIQVIARAASILRALKADRAGLSLGQIAEAVNLPRSTVQRIVGALVAERLVISDNNGRGLRLGPEVAALAEAAQYNVVEICRLSLMELTLATGETADLSVLRGPNMIFLDQVPGTHRLRTVSSVGEEFPLTTTANGKAALSLLEPGRAERLVREEWDRRGMRGDVKKFLATLDPVRETGLAFDLDQHTPGISAVGFAFADHVGDIHAISVPVPSTRFNEIRPNVKAALQKTALHIRKIMAKP